MQQPAWSPQTMQQSGSQGQAYSRDSAFGGWNATSAQPTGLLSNTGQPYSPAFPPPTGSIASAGNVQVLLICKDVYVRDTFQTALSQIPVSCELLTASSAVEALARAGQQGITTLAPFADIIFAQAQVLVEDLSLVQKLKRYHNAPLILLQSSMETALFLGADDFLVGPTSSEPLRKEQLAVLVLKCRLARQQAGMPTSNSRSTMQASNSIGGFNMHGMQQYSMQTVPNASTSIMSNGGMPQQSAEPASQVSGAMFDLMQQVQALKQQMVARKETPGSPAQGTRMGNGSSSNVVNLPPLAVPSANGLASASSLSGSGGYAMPDSPGSSRSNSFVAPAPTPGRYRPRSRSPLGGPVATASSLQQGQGTDRGTSSAPESPDSGMWGVADSPSAFVGGQGGTVDDSTSVPSLPDGRGAGGSDRMMRESLTALLDDDLLASRRTGATAGSSSSTCTAAYTAASSRGAPSVSSGMRQPTGESQRSAAEAKDSNSSPKAGMVDSSTQVTSSLSMAPGALSAALNSTSSALHVSGLQPIGESSTEELVNLGSPPRTSPSPSFTMRQSQTTASSSEPASMSSQLGMVGMDITFSPPVVPEDSMTSSVTLKPIRTKSAARGAAAGAGVSHADMAGGMTSAPITPRRRARILLASHPILVTRDDLY